jgi:DNA-binding transcriptional MerR regulator
MAQALGVIAGVVGILSSIGGVVAAFANGGVKMPSMPSVPQYKIPEDQMKMLNQQIANNNALSNQAQQQAQQALAMYSQGQLSPAYEAIYNQQYQNALNNLKQQLAAAGFTQNSTQWQSAMNSFNNWANTTKAQLLQKQLQDSLTAAGLSAEQQKMMLSSWQTQSGITAQNAQTQAAISNAYANQVSAYANAQAQRDATTGAIIRAGQNFANSLGDLGQSIGTSSQADSGISSGTGSLTTPEISSSLIEGSNLSLGDLGQGSFE